MGVLNSKLDSFRNIPAITDIATLDNSYYLQCCHSFFVILFLGGLFVFCEQALRVDVVTGFVILLCLCFVSGSVMLNS